MKNAWIDQRAESVSFMRQGCYNFKSERMSGMMVISFSEQNFCHLVDLDDVKDEG